MLNHRRGRPFRHRRQLRRRIECQFRCIQKRICERDAAQFGVLVDDRLKRLLQLLQPLHTTQLREHLAIHAEEARLELQAVRTHQVHAALIEVLQREDLEHARPLPRRHLVLSTCAVAPGTLDRRTEAAIRNGLLQPLLLGEPRKVTCISQPVERLGRILDGQLTHVWVGQHAIKYGIVQLCAVALFLERRQNKELA